MVNSSQQSFGGTLRNGSHEVGSKFASQNYGLNNNALPEIAPRIIQNSANICDERGNLYNCCERGSDESQDRGSTLQSAFAKRQFLQEAPL